ncbi:MAG: abortive infection system antitoxin AbiGi family protein [Halanaerobium sp.]|nr:abortive infection system antitoxin AbiGi family protein [Halanaerobium sp.]
MQQYNSTIYWHFTGSPDNIDWGKVSQPHDILAEGKPKDEEQAAGILERILKSRKILSSCSESIFGEMKTMEFCSVCDIPLKDLYFHAEYYGKVAIGFRPAKIHSHFNPVLYLDGEKMAGPMLQKELHAIQNQLNGHSILLSLIKKTLFSENSNRTFYREREWRHFGPFHFTPEDVAAIIIPGNFFSRIRNLLLADGYPENISMVSWDVVKKV